MQRKTLFEQILLIDLNSGSILLMIVLLMVMMFVPIFFVGHLFILFYDKEFIFVGIYGDNYQWASSR